MADAHGLDLSTFLSWLAFLFVNLVNLLSQPESLSLRIFMFCISRQRWWRMRETIVVVFEWEKNKKHEEQGMFVVSNNYLQEVNEHLETWVRVGQVQVRPELEVTQQLQLVEERLLGFGIGWSEGIEQDRVDRLLRWRGEEGIVGVRLWGR